jgi:hypothetical protein
VYLGSGNLILVEDTGFIPIFLSICGLFFSEN